MIRNYFIKLSFDGSPFHGWQIQKNTKNTVQEIVNEAFSRILRESCVLNGCGRTDAGVHAREFFADLQVKGDMIERETSRVIFKLNQYLPSSIAIHGIYKVPDLANARFAATRRTYEYIISISKDPFLEGRAWQIHDLPDVRRMDQAARILKKHTDFASFCRSGGGQKTTLCRIYKARWEKQGSLLIFTITADRFLRNMVRALAGTFLEVGRGRLNLTEFEEIIRSRDRSAAGKSALACGLYLTRVEYPSSILK